jgi:hypothetical protein
MSLTGDDAPRFILWHNYSITFKKTVILTAMILIASNAIEHN